MSDVTLHVGEPIKASAGADTGTVNVHSRAERGEGCGVEGVGWKTSGGSSAWAGWWWRRGQVHLGLMSPPPTEAPATFPLFSRDLMKIPIELAFPEGGGGGHRPPQRPQRDGRAFLSTVGGRGGRGSARKPSRARGGGEGGTEVASGDNGVWVNPGVWRAQGRPCRTSPGA